MNGKEQAGMPAKPLTEEGSGTGEGRAPVMAKPGRAIPPVDPDLMALAWEILADRAERATRKRRMIDTQGVALAAWLDFTGTLAPDGDVEDGEGAFREGVATVGALARRLTALADVLARIEPGSHPIDALVGVAAEAPLGGAEERAQFQLLDFLSRADRAATH